MRIAVCIKQVPDTETKIKIKADQSGIESSGIKWIISPYDEHAIEEALKTKQDNSGSTVTVFTAGPKSRSQEALRTALAMGCDEAVLIDVPEFCDNRMAAKSLAEAIKKEGDFDLAFTGKLAIDDNSAAVTQMLASELDWPHVTVVSKLTIENAVATSEREVEGGKREVFETPLPVVLGTNKGLNTPRYASLPGIMKAKKKPIKEFSLGDLSIEESESKIRYSEFALPPEKPPVKMIEGEVSQQVSTLSSLLREEAKVL